MNVWATLLNLNVFGEAQKNNKKVILFLVSKRFHFCCVQPELARFSAALGDFEKRTFGYRCSL